MERERGEHIGNDRGEVERPPLMEHRLTSSSCAFAIALAVIPACGSDRDTSGGPWSSSFTAGASAGDEGGADESSDAGSTETVSDGSAGPSGGPSSADSGDGTPKLDVAADTAADSGDGGACPCSGDVEVIYLLSADAAPELWSYDPLDDSFQQRGPLGCQVPGNQGPFSMAVERSGRAWVQYKVLDLGQFPPISSSDLYLVDLDDPSQCSDPGYTPFSNGWDRFGMGFVSNSVADPCDKLYAVHYDQNQSIGPGTGKVGALNEASMTVETIAPLGYNGLQRGRGEWNG